MKHLKTFNEKMVLKNYDNYVKLVANAYKDAPDFEESEKYRWDILNKSNYTFFKRLISKVEVIFVTTNKALSGTTINILDRPYRVEFMVNEPYSSQKEMKNSFHDNGILYISMDYSEHPIFNVIDNIVFRTVHDYIVHILADVDFSGKGEIAAFNAHAKLAPNEAIPAIFTEVVGQASYFLTYGNFPKQKITVLKGFDYVNVGAVDGYDVVNKELVVVNKNESNHIKKFNELYDSEDAKKLKISHEELKKMVAMGYEHSFEPGKWHGKNSADLNIAIGNNTYNSNKFDKFGILDVLYKKILKSIPDLNKFKLVSDGFDNDKKFSFNREIILDVPNLDDNYSIKINLWFNYKFKDDDVFEDEKANTINLLFVPSITTTRTSIGLEEIGGIELNSANDISDDEVTRVFYKLDKALYGSPDKEDDELKRKFKVSRTGISIDELVKTLPEIKDKLGKFSIFIKGKYGIDILK